MMNDSVTVGMGTLWLICDYKMIIHIYICIRAEYSISSTILTLSSCNRFVAMKFEKLDPRDAESSGRMALQKA